MNPNDTVICSNATAGVWGSAEGFPVAPSLQSVRMRYPSYNVTIDQCANGYVVTFGDGERFVITNLTEVGELIVKHVATKALEK